VQAKLPSFIHTYKPDLQKHNRKEELSLQPLLAIHLNSGYSQEAQTNGNGQIVYSLLIIAFFVMVIAWVNYINLSTARATQRAKEVGVRKAIGSQQWQLIYQFMTESMLVNVLAIVAALTLIQFTLPLFSHLTGQALTFTLWKQAWFWQVFVLLLVAGSLISGLYPAFVLSSVKPISVLKGGIVFVRGGKSLRKSLVVFQFAVSVCLMAGTLAVYQQINYMRDYDVGVNTEGMVVVKAPVVMDNKNDSTYAKAIRQFKAQLGHYAAIQHITVTSHIPGDEITGDNIRRENADKEQSYFIKNLSVDEAFIPAYELKMKAGRNFSEGFIPDKEAVILNEAAIKMLGFATPQAAINQKVVLLGGARKIIGVVDNYYHNIHSVTANTPIVLQMSHWNSTYLSLKVNSREIKGSLQLAKAAYEEVFSGNPFSYFFLNAFFEEQYKADKQFGKVFGLFSGLAICIACMGLFGLASLMINQRTKEVGVRKVLGASVPSIVALLSKDIIRLILVANLVAWPLTYWGISRWLENYAFRMDIHIWLFLLPALAVLLIALLTVSIQTIKAARANPVKSLKYE
jgi:putative ABC transport system permease protein